MKSNDKEKSKKQQAGIQTVKHTDKKRSNNLKDSPTNRKRYVFRMLKVLSSEILEGSILSSNMVLVNRRPGHFSFRIVKGHHHKRSIKPFSAD
jgi:hypothetical protein